MSETFVTPAPAAPSPRGRGTLLRFDNVGVEYRVREGCMVSLEGVSLEIRRNMVTALIGESGSGKTTLTACVLGMLAPNAALRPDSHIWFDSQTSESVDLLALSPSQMRSFRWQKASMVFQAAQNAFSPTLSLGRQILDTVIDHGADLGAARQRMLDLLRLVRLDPDRVVSSYPHQLSGGMRQRVLLVMAMILEPELIILDEPTTALDLITQAYIFDIFEQVHKSRSQTMLFITHDLAAVARLAQRVGVLYGGTLVEMGSVEDLFARPQHPYTQALLASIPSVRGGRASAGSERPALVSAPEPDRLSRPPGCIFAHRCPEATDLCRAQIPRLHPMGDQGIEVACHLRGTSV